MPGWSFGSAFRAISDQLFGDDLAEELDHDITSAATKSRQQHPVAVPQRANGHASGHSNFRSSPQHQPTASSTKAPNPAALSPDQLQQSMKQLMGHPQLWALYKEELSQQEQPTNPETVRRVLVEFLNEHGHEMVPVAAPKQRSHSIFQGLNMGLEEESTHVSRTRPAIQLHKAPPTPTPQQDDLQSRMIRLMKQPDLWKRYKELLSQEESPDDPATIRRLFQEFWNERSEEIQKLENSNHPTPPAVKSTAPKPPVAPTSRRISSSIFQALNTDLDGESQHLVSSHTNRQRNPAPLPPQPQDTTQRQLRLLRASPELYAKYQERLLMDESEENTSAADLLTKFLKEHQAELDELDRADQEAKRQEAMEASLLHLETATLAEEECETIKPKRRERPSLSQTEHRSMKHDNRQKLMAYRDSISSRSMRSVQEAIGALAGEMEKTDTNNTEDTFSFEPAKRGNLSSQSDHPRQDRRQQFMAYRESISSRSKRTVLNAMEALAGETEDSKKLEATDLKTPAAATPTPVPPRAVVDQEKMVTKKSSKNGSAKSPHEEASLSMDLSLHAGWRRMSIFLTHEMDSMNSELESETSSRRSARTIGDLDSKATTAVATHSGPLESSVPMRFQVKDEEDDDAMLLQAAEIAQRRRGSRDNVVLLESIKDNEEEEEEGVVDNVSDHVGAALHDPMMAVTVHNDDAVVDITSVKEGADKHEMGQSENDGADKSDDDSLI